MTIDSLSSNFRMLSRVKPSVRSTATSRVRSRIDMAMVLAQTSKRGEDDGSADAQDECLHVAERGDEIEFECLFALALRGHRSAVEHVVDGVGRQWHVFGSIDANKVKAGRVFEPVDGFLQILGVEVEVAGGRIDGIDAAHRQVEIGGKDCALQMDVVANFPVVFFGKCNVDDAAVRGRASRRRAARRA